MGESSSSGKTAMTWDDALSINALTSYLRRVNPAHLPLLEFCVDCSAFLKRGNSGSEAERASCAAAQTAPGATAGPSGHGLFAGAAAWQTFREEFEQGHVRGAAATP